MNPTVFTKFIVPHKILQPYIKYFAIRKFDTGEDVYPKAVFADHEIIVSLFIHSDPHKYEPSEKGEYGFAGDLSIACHFIGMQTSTKGFVVFKGDTKILCIHFKPAGFIHLFNISPKEIFNKLGEAEALLSNEIRTLYDQIQEQKNISQGLCLLEKYLISKLLTRKARYRHSAIRMASDFLISQKGIYPIKKLAYDCNMTLQTLETQFTDQVGTDPKSFCGIVRFNTAVNMKLYNPAMLWTSVAHSCGFYDQMHLIKDFKKFTSLSPKNFLRLINPPVETFIKA